jgi:hypothetical protein
MDAIIHFKFDLPNSKVKNDLNSIVKSIEILGLEESPTSFLGSIVHRVESEEYLFFTDSKRESIVLFNKSGQFVRSISHMGAGPEEYSFLANFWIDENNIVVHDTPNSRLQYYNFNGGFIRSQKVPYQNRSMFLLNEHFFVDVSRNPINTKGQFNILELDRDMNIIKSHIPIQKTKELSSSWGYNSFSKSGNSVLFHDPNSDTIYLKKESRFSPFIKLDFGDLWFWSANEKKNNLSRNDIYNWANRKDIIKSSSFHFSQTHYLGQISLNNELYTYFGELSTQKHLLIDKENIEDRNIRFRPIGWDGNKLLISFNSDELKDFLEQFDVAKISFKSNLTLDQIGDSENPYLLWITF